MRNIFAFGKIETAVDFGGVKKFSGEERFGRRCVLLTLLGATVVITFRKKPGSGKLWA
jgi:hypothetical protein